MILVGWCPLLLPFDLKGCTSSSRRLRGTLLVGTVGSIIHNNRKPPILLHFTSKRHKESTANNSYKNANLHAIVFGVLRQARGLEAETG